MESHWFDGQIFDRLREINGLVEIAQSLIDGVRKRVHDGRLLISGDHQRRAGMLFQVAGERRNPAGGNVRSSRRGGNRAHAKFSRQRAREAFDVGGAHPQAMIGHRAGVRGRGFDGVQPVHFRFGVFDAALSAQIPARSERFPARW